MQQRNLTERQRLRGTKSKISDPDLRELRASDPWELLQQNLRRTFGAELDITPFREEYHSYIQVQVLKGTVEGFKLKRYRVRVPRHEPGPPETLTDTDYANLLRVPDRRTIAGKRDYAVLRVLGDCGLRSAELRGLRARDLRRPRANARHHRLYVRGKGGREREVPVPEAVQQALEAWMAVHPLARGVGLLDEQPLFVRLGRHAAQQPLPSPPWACTGSCTATARPPVCRSGSRTRTRSGPTGPRTCSRPAFPSTRCPRGSGTSICVPPRGTPPRDPSGSMRSPTCSTPPPCRAAGGLGGVRDQLAIERIRSRRHPGRGRRLCPRPGGA